MKKYLEIVAKLFRSLFGEINYTQPKWITNSLSFLKAKFQTHPKLYKKFFFTTLGVAATVGSGYFIKNYYDHLPKPNAASLTVHRISSYDFNKPEPRSLAITFNKSVADVNSVGKIIAEGLKLKPEIKGQWIWASDRELKFTPLQEQGKLEWPIGESFEGSISKKILSPNIILEKYNFKFKIDDLKASVINEKFYQDPRFSENKKVTATFIFNYPIDPESLKKRLKLSEVLENGLEKKSKYELNISFDDLKSAAYVQTSNIKIPETDTQFKITLEAGYTSSFGGTAASDITATAKVPSIYEYFKITNAFIVIARNEKYESEQILKISNIAEISTEELAKSLEVYELPVHLDPAETKKKAYVWNSVSEVTSDVIKRSKKIKLDLIPTEQAISLEHSFRFNTVPGRGLYVKIRKNATSFGGYKLKDDYEKVVTVPQYPSDLQIMGKGSLIPLTGSQQLSLVSRNLNKITYQIHQIRTEQINHLIPSLVYEYSKPESYDIRPDRIAERFTGEIPLINKNPQKNQYSSIDLAPFLKGGKKGLFLIKANSKDSAAFAQDQRFIIITDLGLIVKKNIAKSYDVFVQNITTGLPVAGAKVSIMGQNGLNVLTVDTGPNGQASFPDLTDFKNDKAPIAFVAQMGESFSFVPYDSYARQIDLTSYDIGGVQDSSSSDQLNAFIFSDRGIYRPGEKADFGFIVRSKNWSKSFLNIPIEIIVTNPSGQEVLKEILKVSSNTMEELSFKSEDYFQTGDYSVTAYIKQQNKVPIAIGSTTIQVEEFQPDQIKVRTSLSQTDSEGWIKPKDLKLNLSAFNLYGKPATNRKARTKLRVRATDVYFKKWKDYYFNVPKPSQLEINDSLPDQTTDDKGEVSWDLKLDQLEKSVYRLNLDSEVFETEGGKSVKSQIGQLISDQDYLLGFKSEQLDLSFIKKDAQAVIDILTINSKLESIAIKNIDVDLVESKPTSVLMRLPNDTYAYQTVYKKNIIKSFKIDTNVKATKIKIDSSKVGEYTLVFKDAEKNELNRFSYNIVGQADVERGLEKSSALKLGLNKKDYKQNEEIEVQIKSPYAGAGLITIERDKVYATHWFKTTTKSTVEKIKIPAGLEGQAYIVVTMLRDAGSEEIYTSPLAFGAASFAIDLEARKSKIDIQAPDLVKPGELLSIKLKTEQKTKAAVYLVDEGILQVANYKLPQPLNYFFQKKALQVNTFQILDLVMPDFNRLLPAAAGGDEAARLGQSINPFKRKSLPPVAHWFGIVDLNDKWTTLKYEVPDYFNGNLRLMVVTGDDQKLGSLATDVNVRGDFIINATATAFTAPEDEFEVNLIIANQLKGSGADAQLDVDLKTDEGYTLKDTTQNKVNVPENKEKSFNFKLKATDKLGSHPIYISAGQGAKKAKLEIQVSNRPAVPYQQSIDWKIISDKTLDLDVLNDKKPEFKKNYLQFHTTIEDIVKPFEAFYEVNDYLCSEQIASRLAPLIQKSVKTKDDKDKVNKLISLLRSRQKTGGAFSLYPQNENIDYDVSLHLGMIFLYMQEKGEPIPEDIWKRYLESLKSDYNQTASKSDLYRKAKAIYILVRSQYVPKEDLKNMATLIKDKNYKKDFTSVAAEYLAASFKISLQDDLSQRAIKLADENSAINQDEWFIFPNSDGYEKFALITKHFPDKANEIFTSKIFFDLIDQANKRQLNTYSSSYLLMSLDSILKSGTSSANFEKIQIAAFDSTKKEVQIVKSKKMDFTDMVKSIKVTNAGGIPVLASYVYGGFAKDENMKQNFSGIEISRSIEDDKGQEVKDVSVGDELTVKIRARSQTKLTSSVIISDLLPAGFEVNLKSIRKNNLQSIQETDSGEGGNSYTPNEGEDGASPPADDPASDPTDSGASLWPLQILIQKVYAQTNKVETTVSPMSTELVDVREDRVNIYTTLNENMQEYTYRIKAVSKGQYRIPGIYAKGMYRTDLSGQGNSGQISVK